MLPTTQSRHLKRSCLLAVLPGNCCSWLLSVMTASWVMFWVLRMCFVAWVSWNHIYKWNINRFEFHFFSLSLQDQPQHVLAHYVLVLAESTRAFTMEAEQPVALQRVCPAHPHQPTTCGLINFGYFVLQLLQWLPTGSQTCPGSSSSWHWWSVWCLAMRAMYLASTSEWQCGILVFLNLAYSTNIISSSSIQVATNDRISF